MSSTYRYQKSVNRHHYSIFKRRLLIASLIVLLIALVVGALIYNVRHSNKKTKVTSQTTSYQVGNVLQTTYSPYFKFDDTGKWAISSNDSTATRYTYYQYRGFQVQHELNIYVNEVPIQLYLATARVLPVRLVNGNSLDVTSVSGTCIGAYNPGELHKVREVSIAQTLMLCDPDTPQYSVTLSEIGGNYKLNLHRNDGTPVQFVITYKNLTIDPDQATIVRIANSFKAR